MRLVPRYTLKKKRIILPIRVYVQDLQGIYTLQFGDVCWVVQNIDCHMYRHNPSKYRKVPTFKYHFSTEASAIKYIKEKYGS